MRNILLVISGPSGVGKGTVVEKLNGNGEFALSVSCTTRPPRKGEKHGKSYFFLSREEFEQKIKENDFLEYDNHFENFYGTPKSFVEEKLKSQSVILEIDVNGALNVKKSYPEAVLVILTPPDMETLKKRLRGRRTESEEELELRLSRARWELSQADKFDYRVVNGAFEETISNIKNIISEEKNRV